VHSDHTIAVYCVLWMIVQTCHKIWAQMGHAEAHVSPSRCVYIIAAVILHPNNNGQIVIFAFVCLAVLVASASWAKRR
jgi:hypothetical protein